MKSWLFWSTSCCDLTLDEVVTIFRSVHPNKHMLGKGNETTTIKDRWKLWGKSCKYAHKHFSLSLLWKQISWLPQQHTFNSLQNRPKTPCSLPQTLDLRRETSLEKTQDAVCICNYNTHKWTRTSGLGEASVKGRSAIWNMHIKFDFSGMSAQPWTVG